MPVMLPRTMSEQWEALRPRFHRFRSWLGTPERTHGLVLLLWPLVALVIAGLVLRSVSTAKELADLISAIASLMWPVVAIVIVSWFRPELRAIMSRIRKGKFLGQEIELADLEAKTKAAEETAAMIVSATGSAAGIGSATAEGDGAETAGISAGAVQDEIEEVLREATRSPRLGLMLLSAKIERALGEYGSVVPELHTPGGLSVPLVGRTAEFAKALRSFNAVRNRIVHGDNADDDEIAGAFDSGTRLLRLLLSTPRPSAETTKGPDDGD